MTTLAHLTGSVDCVTSIHRLLNSVYFKDLTAFCSIQLLVVNSPNSVLHGLLVEAIHTGRAVALLPDRELASLYPKQIQNTNTNTNNCISH